MTRRIIILFALAISAGLLLVACERSASNPMMATPTAAGTNTTPQPLGLLHLQDLGTQTAAYLQTEVALGVITAAPTTNSSVASATPTPVGMQSTPGSATQPPLVLATVTPAGGAAASTPTPAPAIVVPTATPGRPSSYTLHAGEFVYCIARRFDVNPTDLENLNGLGAGSVLQPGTSLSIPQTGSFPGTRALQPHPAQYTVAVNDTFYSIACAYGDVDPSAIAAANGLTLTSPLSAGQVLNIP